MKKLLYISLVLAICGAIASFMSSQTKICRSLGKIIISLPSSKEAINHITQRTSIYRTSQKDRWVVSSRRFFYLQKDERGFKFIKNILQSVYYKELNKDVTLFAQYQAAHIGDPYDPNTTLRPIYAISTNKIIKETIPDMEFFEIMKGARYICDEKDLTLALDNYYKTQIFLFGTVLIILSIIINGTLQLKF